MLLNELESQSAKLKAYIGIFVVCALIALYMAGYWFLWKMDLPAYSATPKTIIDYWIYYGEQPEVKKWLLICLAGGAAPALVIFIVLVMPLKKKLHGDARFANSRELKKNGLLGEAGLIIGKWGSKFILLPGQLGALCSAPPRSGKGVGLVQPNMLSWPDSVVLLDIRNESFRITSGFRSTFSDVYLFNPVDPERRTMQWNPLDYVSDDPLLRVNDLQKIGNMLSPDPAEGDPFWPAACRTLFLGIALYIFETPGLPRTFGEIVRQIMFGEGETVGERWKALVEERDQTDNPLSSACKAALYDFIYTSGNTQSSIRKTFTAKLELWLNPLIDAATAESSFDLRDLRKRRISVYIGVKPGDLEYLSLLINLFTQQMVLLNMAEMPEDNPEYKYKLAWIMDEFTAVGRMPIVAKSIGYMGGYNIIPFIIIQSQSQLRATYGEHVARTIIECLAAEIVFAPKDKDHARSISESLGDTTVSNKSKSRPAFSTKGGSTNTSDAKRALLLPQEVRKIGKRREIVFMENMNAILCEKVFYYKERVFKKRILEPAYIPQINYVRPTSPVKQLSSNQTATEEKDNESVIKYVDREIAPEDIKTIDKLSLTDYNINFDNIEVPKGEPITDEEMKEVFGSFLNTIAD